jgi:hypothetical protein
MISMQIQKHYTRLRGYGDEAVADEYAQWQYSALVFQAAIYHIG